MIIHRIDGAKSYTWEGASWRGRALWVPGSLTKTLVLVYKTNMATFPQFSCSLWVPRAFSGRPVLGAA